jgi:8-oxoguanine deaminase
VLPGLINTHHHYYQTLTRSLGCALNKELFAWLSNLYPVWSGLTSEMVDISTRLACAELLLSGCTTSADHHYLFTDKSTDALERQVDAVRDSGIRAVLTRGSMSIGVDDGGLPPQNTVQDEEVILDDSERVINRFHSAGPGSMLSIALAPCSPFSVSPQLMKDTARLAAQYNVLLHTHLGETRDENSYCESRFGMRPFDFLEQCGWLGDSTWLAHGIHFTSDEISKLGEHGVGIAHCPSSNMLLGSGHCPVLELGDSGCSVGLAVDGSASNDGSNMMQEVRQAFLLHRLHYGSAKFGHLEALKMATSGSAACLNRNDIGSLEPGRQADIAMFRLDELRFSGAGDPLAALVLCGADRADRVMVNGQWLVENGELVNCDVGKLRARHHSLAHELQARA